MKIVTAEQYSDEWYASRLGKPTGSSYRDVLAKGTGVTRKKYVVKLALELVTGAREDNFKSQAMQDGTDREPIARALFESRNNVIVDEVGFCLHDTIETGVSPDGFIDSDGLLEIKCPTPAVHLEYMGRKDAPPEYIAQIQGQLWVTGRKWCKFISYNPAFPENAQLITRHVERDEKFIKTLEEEIVKFIEEVKAEAESIRAYHE